VWHHPYITLAVALVVLVLLALLVRTIWRAARRAIRGFREAPATETSNSA